MTLPLFCALHLVYGALMARVTLPRMQSEGEVLGLPFVVSLVPVGLISAPLGAALARYVPAWFLQGVDFPGWLGPWERYHLVVLFAVGAAAFASTIAGSFITIAALARDRSGPALIPLVVAGMVAVATFLVDTPGVVNVSAEQRLFEHPAGLLSLAVAVCLAAALSFSRARLSAPASETGA